MLAQVRGEQEGFAAERAAVGSAAGVDLLVLPQPRLVEIAFPTGAADVRPGLGVLLGVLLQLGRLRELSLAGFTDVRSRRWDFSRRSLRVDAVALLMSLDFIPAPERGVAVRAGELR